MVGVLVFDGFYMDDEKMAYCPLKKYNSASVPCYFSSEWVYIDKGSGFDTVCKDSQ